jgi:hypothetical protein
VDIVPDELVPTWRNSRTGSETISKRLDRVFLSEDLVIGKGKIRSWVAYPYLSDHAPIFLHFDSLPFPIAFPFKLNSSWLLEARFLQFSKRSLE